MSGMKNLAKQTLQGKTKQRLLSLPNKFSGLGAAGNKGLTFKIKTS
jgi:hypothetical protein